MILGALTVPVQAQQSTNGNNTYTLTGVVADSIGNVEFCTVTLSRNKEQVAGTVADQFGNFQVKKLEPGDYKVIFTHLTHKQISVPVTITGDTDMGKVMLTVKDIKINQVVVQQRFIERRSDRYIVSLKGNPMAKNRSIGSLLGWLPGVTNFGGYRINGMKGTKIYINGREIRNTAELSGIQADQVDQVEVIPVAGSAFDAGTMGGAIRITLRKLAEGSLYGSVGAGVNFTDDGFYSTDIYSPFNLRYKKFNIYNYFTFRNGHPYSREKTTETAQDAAQTLLSQSIEEITNKQFNYYDNLSFVYDINERHSIGANLTINMEESRPKTETLYDLSSTYNSKTAEGKIYSHQYQAALNYIYALDDKGSTMTLVADYLKLKSGNRNLYNFNLINGIDTVLQNRYATDADRFKGTASFQMRIGKQSMLEFGGEYYYHNTKRDIWLASQLGDTKEWVTIDDQSDIFSYIGEGYAGYLSFSSMIGMFGYNVGVRAQNDILKYDATKLGLQSRKNYFGIYPTVGMSYFINPQKQTMVALSYKRGLNLPQFAYLTPAVSNLGNSVFVKGNPAIKPDTWDMVQTAFALNGTYTIAYTFVRTLDQVSQMLFTETLDDGSTATYLMPMNIGQRLGHIVSVSAPFKPFKWWTSKADANMSWITEDYIVNYTQKKKYNSFIGQFYWNNSFAFKNSWGGNINFRYETPFKISNFSYDARFNIDASIYHRIFKRKLYVSIGVQNILNIRQDSRTWGSGVGYDTNPLAGQRHYTLRIIYDFKQGNKKMAPKQSRTVQGQVSEKMPSQQSSL